MQEEFKVGIYKAKIVDANYKYYYNRERFEEEDGKRQSVMLHDLRPTQIEDEHLIFKLCLDSSLIEPILAVLQEVEQTDDDWLSRIMELSWDFDSMAAYAVEQKFATTKIMNRYHDVIARREIISSPWKDEICVKHRLLRLDRASQYKQRLFEVPQSVTTLVQDRHTQYEMMLEVPSGEHRKDFIRLLESVCTALRSSLGNATGAAPPPPPTPTEESAHHHHHHQ
jgi:hypothetical protein